MAAIVIDGKEIAKKKRLEMVDQVEEMKKQNFIPGLAVILVGDNQASKTYVSSKQKTARELGMHNVLIEYPASISEKELLAQIDELNKDDDIHGDRKSVV